MGWHSGMPTRGRVGPGIGCKLPMLAVCKGNCQNALLITFLLITCRLLLLVVFYYSLYPAVHMIELPA